MNWVIPGTIVGLLVALYGVYRALARKEPRIGGLLAVVGAVIILVVLLASRRSPKEA